MHWTDDPRLAVVYDVECAGRWDHDLYLAVADELAAGTVADVGCGTGVFAVDLARRGHRAIGVDPAAAMLDAARPRPGGDLVDWRLGGADVLGADEVDLVVMMGHVAQYFVTDESWAGVLDDVHRALRPGGHLVFETRNPRIRGWESWTEALTRSTYPHPDGGEFTSWVEVVEVGGDAASPWETHLGHTLLPGGEHLVSSETLRFRPWSEVLASTASADFVPEHVWGEWTRGEFDEATSPEIIVVAAVGPPRRVLPD